MHFNVYLDDDTGHRLNAFAQQAGESRNALIRRAVRQMLDGQTRPKWPESVLKHQGFSDFPDVDAQRAELIPPSADPLA
jgi:hypothetical protein